MKLTVNDRFEILAAAFYKATGMMAPGKDDRSGTHTNAERVEAWQAWRTANYTSVNNALDAVEHFFPEPTTCEVQGWREATDEPESWTRRGSWWETERCLVVVVGRAGRKYLAFGRAIRASESDPVEWKAEGYNGPWEIVAWCPVPAVPEGVELDPC